MASNRKGQAPPRYDEAFKEGAVRLVVERKRSPVEVAAELGVHKDTLKRWLRESGYSLESHREQSRSERVRELESEVKALRKALAEKSEEVEILKKSVGILSRP